jgi:membrane associated rhomboid family serine protease
MLNAGINRFGSSAPVVKNLLFINTLMLLATYVVQNTFGKDLVYTLGLFYPESSYFKVHQIITHMFMHANLMHLFFNMFALWMFGRALENAWGSKRFLTYYLLTGIGAAVLHTFVNYIEYTPVRHFVQVFAESPTPAMMTEFAQKFIGNPELQNNLLDYATNWTAHINNPDFTDKAVNMVNLVYDRIISVPTVGASGAVYGVLLGFGMLFPNTILMLIFPPIPIKAKYMVMIFAGIELYLGLEQRGSNIAHFAHLGGMLFGYLIIRYWNRKRANFY